VKATFTLVFGGQVFDLQRPIVVAQLSNGEARVGRVRHASNAEHMEVAQTDPGHLNSDRKSNRRNKTIA
jgi:hypothetical protein